MTEKTKRGVRTPQPKSDLQFAAHREFVAIAQIDNILQSLPARSARTVLDRCAPGVFERLNQEAMAAQAERMERVKAMQALVPTGPDEPTGPELN